MDIATLGAALNGSAEYVNSHFKGGSNIQIVDNPDGTQTINASGEVSSEDTVARAEIAAIKDGETLDSFGDVETALSAKQNTISDLSTIRSGAALGATAVQPETGKGLSTNDYTTAEKTKLAGIAEGAEVNVQSNWTQTTTTADDYIKNKPTLGTAAAKNATDTYNSTGDDVTTGKAVAAALATLPEPMIFKGSLGTGGTITTLPTASSSNKGYVYKVITAGTYASQSAKVGDTFISDGATWVLIPSGDEPSGTVTNVAVANGGGLTVSGSPVTSSGTITVGHSNSVTAETSSSVKKFTYDEYGHVTDSSELSIAESDALASGIDSTKVEQIETNKNNISTDEAALVELIDGGAKNLLNISDSNAIDYNAAHTISNDTLTVSGTSSYARVAYPVTLKKGSYQFVVTVNSLSEESRIRFNTASAGSGDTIAPDISISQTGDYIMTITLAADTTFYIMFYSRIVSGTAASETQYSSIMLCTKAAWDISHAYVPYRKDLAELTVDTDEDRASLVDIVDGGAKNLINQANDSFTATTKDYYIALPDGNYVVYFGSLASTDTDATTCQAAFCDESSAVSNSVQISRGSDVYGEFSLSAPCTKLRLYASDSTAHGSGDTCTFTNIMICTKAAWDISQTYVPYRPSYQELYERVVALEQANQ